METTLTEPSNRILILSREHHFGLLFCWRINQGIKKKIAPKRIKNYVSFFWNNHLREHFEEEEGCLFLKVMDDKCIKAMQQQLKLSLIFKQMDKANVAISYEAIKQHQELSLYFQQIVETDLPIGYAQLSKLTESLNAHILFEEGEIFPHLENTTDELELTRTDTLLQHSHTVGFNDHFNDKFWAD